ncbi:MAG: nuclear transport factor 2 family protein [Actinomycetota bacterium]
MNNAQMTLRLIFDRQTDFIHSRDLGGLVGQYLEDAILLRFDAESAGRPAISEFFAGYLAKNPEVMSIDAYSEADEMLSYQATMLVGGDEIRTYGMWIVRNGKIWRQFAGLIEG